MPNTAYLGFSAHTGELSDNFDIVKVETRNLYSPVGSASSTDSKYGRKTKAGRGKKQSSGGGWGLVLLQDDSVLWCMRWRILWLEDVQPEEPILKILRSAG